MPEDDRVLQFCDYLVDNYLTEDSTFPPYMWASNSSSLIFTTNACESFHSKFNECFYKSHPDIFKFTDILLNFQAEVYVKIRTAQRLEKKLDTTARRKVDFIENRLIEYYVNQNITKLDFIKSVCNYYAANF